MHTCKTNVCNHESHKYYKEGYNFVRVTGLAIQLVCVRCGNRGMSDGSSGRDVVTNEWYADTNGRPFVDYYCVGCKFELETK